MCGKRVFAACLIIISQQMTANAVDIVLGTGVTNNNTPRSIGSIDSNYQIVATKDYTTGLPISLVSSNAYVWNYNDSRFATAPDSAQWISPYPISTGVPTGWYTFRTTFNLNGFDPNKFKINGFLAIDNQTRGPGLLINGIDTGFALSLTDDNFVRLNPFSISSGFTNGLNTLDFIVFNTGGPTGLLVSMTGTFAVPETSTYIMGLTITLIFLLIGWRRKYHLIQQRTIVMN